MLTIAILHSLSAVHRMQDNLDESERMARLAVELAENHLGEQHSFHISALNDLANTLRSKGKEEDAKQLYARAVAILEERGELNKQYAVALGNLASLLTGMGSYAEAESMYVRLLALWRQKGWDESPERSTLLFDLACLHAKDGRFDSAERLCIAAFTLRKDLVGLEHPDILRILSTLRIIYERKEKALPGLQWVDLGFVHSNLLAIKDLHITSGEPGPYRPVMCISALALVFCDPRSPL